MDHLRGNVLADELRERGGCGPGLGAGAGSGVILVVLSSLAAEGTPRLVLELCRLWRTWAIEVIVVLLNAEPNDLEPEYDAAAIGRVVLGVAPRGFGRYPRLVRDFWLLARRYRPAAILSMPLGWHVFMAIGAHLAGVRRLVAHVGNHPNPGTGAAFRKFCLLVQLGRPFTHRLVCCSRYVQEGVMRHFGVRKGETAVVYNGVAVEEFAARAACARAGRRRDSVFTIGMVARLEIHKDQPTLIRAAGLLTRGGHRFEVWLVGEGSRRDELEALIREEGVADRVKLLGVRRDVAELVGRMDVFAFATTPDEGLGIALIEAMAAGVPVVASDVGACREVLEDGALGLLVPPGDHRALAEAILLARSHAEAARRRAERALDKVRRDFTMEAMAGRYAGLLGLTSGGKP
jgi:glycosyltransferase involved in cell wall biosynthesis